MDWGKGVHNKNRIFVHTNECGVVVIVEGAP